MPKMPYHYQYNHPFFMQKFGLNKFNVTDDSQLSSNVNQQNHQRQPVNEISMSITSNKLNHEIKSESDNETNKHNSSAFSVINNNSHYSHHQNNIFSSANKINDDEESQSRFYIDHSNDFKKVFDLQQKRNQYLNMLNLSKNMLNEHQVNTFINQVLNANSSSSQAVSTNQDYLSNKNYKKARFLSNNEFFIDTSKETLNDQMKRIESEKFNNSSYYHRNNSSSDNQIGNIRFSFNFL